MAKSFCSRSGEVIQYVYLIAISYLFLNTFYVFCRLFIGYAGYGIQAEHDPFCISSIRLQSTSSNLVKVVKAITTLDRVISNNLVDSNDLDDRITDNPEHVSILSDLFSNYLNNKNNKTIISNKTAKYIHDTFECFVNHKDRITMEIGHMDLECENKALLDLLFYPFVEEKRDDYNHDNDSEKYKNKNIPKKIMFDIFDNVTHLDISCMAIKDRYQFPLSLLSLLSVINGTHVNTIQIYTPSDDGWLVSLGSTPLFMKIRNEYKKSNFTLKLTDIVDIRFDSKSGSNRFVDLFGKIHLLTIISNAD